MTPSVLYHWDLLCKHYVTYILSSCSACQGAATANTALPEWWHIWPAGHTTPMISSCFSIFLIRGHWHVHRLLHSASPCNALLCSCSQAPDMVAQSIPLDLHFVVHIHLYVLCYCHGCKSGCITSTEQYLCCGSQLLWGAGCQAVIICLQRA